MKTTNLVAVQDMLDDASMFDEDSLPLVADLSPGSLQAMLALPELEAELLQGPPPPLFLDAPYHAGPFVRRLNAVAGDPPLPLVHSSTFTRGEKLSFVCDRPPFQAITFGTTASAAPLPSRPFWEAIIKPLHYSSSLLLHGQRAQNGNQWISLRQTMLVITL